MISLFFKSVSFCLCVQVYLVGGHLPLALNLKLSREYVLDYLSNVELHGCVDLCVYKTDCLSISFSRDTKGCEMYNVNLNRLTEEETARQNNTVFFEAENWPKVRTGACWNKPCAEKMMCVQHEQSYRCHKDEPVGCKPYVLPEHGIREENPTNTTTSMYSRGATVHVKCQPPFVTTMANPHKWWNVRCKGNYIWSWNYTCYTVEELCTKQILQKFYPTRVFVNATSTIPGWSGSDVFLNSTKGWATLTNNDKQYLQLNFNDTYWVGGLITKGGGNANWVKSYKVSYSEDCAEYSFLLERGFDDEKKFSGNSDAITSVKNNFESPINVKCMRIHPTAYPGGITLRLEVLACKEYDTQ